MYLTAIILSKMHLFLQADRLKFAKSYIESNYL